MVSNNQLLLVVLVILATFSLKITKVKTANATNDEDCLSPWWRLSTGKCVRFLTDDDDSLELLTFKEASNACDRYTAKVLSISNAEEQESFKRTLDEGQLPEIFKLFSQTDIWLDVPSTLLPSTKPKTTATYSNFFSPYENMTEIRNTNFKLAPGTKLLTSCTVVLVDWEKKWFKENCGRKHAVVCEKPKPWSLQKLTTTLLQVIKNFEDYKKELKTNSEEVKILNNTNNKRLEVIKKMARSTWRSYNVSTEDQNETDFDFVKGRNVLAAMTTLYVMDLKEEFREGQRWVENELPKFGQLDYDVPFLEVSSEYIGSLLSLYALTEDPMFFQSALNIANKIEPAYNSRTGLPFDKVNPKTGSTSGKYPSLSTVGGDYLEAVYLADLTNNQTIKKRANKAQEKLVSMKVQGRGLFLNTVNVEDGVFKSNDFGLGSNADDFYRALLGSFIQSNESNLEGLNMFRTVIEDIIHLRKIKSEDQPGLGFVYEFDSVSNKFKEDKMDYETCYAGGMLALGAQKLSNRTLFLLSTDVWTYRKLSTQIAETCYQASNQTATKLGPASFNPQNGLQAGPDPSYNLSPELAETNFYLWRLTGDRKYQERAWEMVTAIQKYCSTPFVGFAPIRDVNKGTDGGGLVRGKPTPIFSSATLKYLYLTFADKEVLSLDKWLFNAVGHPLPICGQDTYPANLCQKE